MDTIRPENQLLQYVARKRIDPLGRRPIEELLSRPFDWNYFRQAAVNHGVAALCYAHLLAACPDLVPAHEMEWLRLHARTVAARNLHLSANLVRLLRRFASQGIRVLPYKGAVLAAMAYRNLALREFVDLDFILGERDLPGARAVLIAEGYKEECEVGNSIVSNGTPGQYAFVAPGEDYLVELHTERTLRHFPKALDPARLTRSLVPVTLNGEEILTFSPEETLVFLSVHGAKDFWARLIWISDVAELVQIAQGFDWEMALAAANELHCGRLVHLAILLANGLLDAPIPPTVLSHARRDRGAQAMAGTVSHWLFATEPASAQARARYRMRMVEGFWPGVRYALRLATAPTTEDRQTVALPQKLSFLYRLIRPIRLLRARDRH